MGAEARLKELGITRPAVPKPVANYLPYRLAGSPLYSSRVRVRAILLALEEVGTKAV
jgi:hypothetical protein